MKPVSMAWVAYTLSMAAMGIVYAFAVISRDLALAYRAPGFLETLIWFHQIQDSIGVIFWCMVAGWIWLVFQHAHGT